jgi:hypothetical protein
MKRVMEIVKDVLKSEVAEINPLSGGVTKNLTTRVVLPDSRIIIIKIGNNSGREKKGYELLKSSSLAKYLPELIAYGDDYLILSNIESNVTLKEVVEKHQAIPSSVLTLFSRILDVKFIFWEENLSTDHPVDGTLIREEFPETQRKIASFFNSEAKLPIKIEGESVSYPSIIEMLAGLGKFLEKQPEYRLTITHGDLKPENILVLDGDNVEGSHFWFVDPEWACHGDWVEALSRLGKWRSSKYATTGESSYRISNGNLEISYESSFPGICYTLENEAMNRGEVFALKVGDKTWKSRYYLYLCASLLREIVLLEKRGLPMSLSSIILGEAAKYFALSRS